MLPLNVTPSLCDSEPIHMPGSIQALGALVAYAPDSGIVLHASANLGRWLPVGDEISGRATAHRGPPGRSIADLLGDAACARLEHALAHRGDGAIRHQVVDLAARPEHGQPAALEAAVHLQRGIAIVELEPAAITIAGDQPRDWMQEFGDTIDALRSAGDMDDLLECSARCVKRLARFDRVMVYRFDEDLSGHVVVDVREPGMESFLDLHYPASDIPAPARELYRSNLARYIANVDEQPVAVLPWLDSARSLPLDMSHAMLRSASPIHLQYLRNMAVGSTLTLSLLVDDRLWGLIAGHHRTPTRLPIRLRRASCALAINVGFLAGWNAQRELASATAAITQARTRIVDAFNRLEAPLPDVIDHCSAALLQIAGAIGGALWRGDTIVGFGQWPSGVRGDSIMRHLRHAFGALTDDLIDTDHAELEPALDASELRSVCGLLAIRLDDAAACGLVWVRPEYRRDVAWGGDPDEPMHIDTDAYGQARISPRASFARWTTLVAGRCRPWSEQDRAAARALLPLGQALTVRAAMTQVSLSAHHFRSLVALQSDAYWQVDTDGRLVALSKPLFAGQGGFEGRTPGELLAPFCDAAAIAALNQALAGKQPFRALRVRGYSETNQREFELVLNGEPMRDQDGRSAGWHGTITDVTRELATRTALQRREAEQQAMLDNDLIAILKLNGDRVVVWKNKAADRIFGHAPDALYGRTTRILYSDDDSYRALGAAYHGVLQAGGHFRSQVRMVRKDGTNLWIDANGVLLSAETQESMWLLADITAMKQAQEQVEHIALHDGLTGLPNRRLLAERLDLALAAAARGAGRLAVCYLDLDGFKRVNDQHGHAAGDQLLKDVALRMQRSVRASDTVCRVGGDEFILLLTPLDQVADCEAVLQRIIAELDQTIALVDGHRARVSATIGVAIFPTDGDQPEVLIGNADRALYQGKKLGRNRIVMYGAVRDAR